MKYYIIAGEPSGDLHASNLMKSLKENDSDWEFRFWGGDLMKEVGGELVRHYTETAYMGIKEVVSNLGKIRANFKLCKSDLLYYKPDVLILVDYPGFNLRIAEFAKKKGMKVFYYISPKVWAWNTGRVKKIKAYVDKMFTILPFETKFYQQHNVPIDYVGNPVLDAIESRDHKGEDINTFKERNGLDSRPIVALLAGSRKQELDYVLPEMLNMIDVFPDYQFVIAGAPSFSQAHYKSFVGGKDVKVIFNQTYELLQQAQGALVTSGTATLETALLDCPQIVCYKMWGNKLFSWFIQKVILKVDFISLVNLILAREGVRELVQESLRFETLKAELGKLLKDQDYRIRIFNNYNQLHQIMGEPGTSQRAAKLMIRALNN
ncbi:lipid-A-disaccharide synthase [Saccharicrinis fermentans]|uniref:Lipid-A-disaccharide synthase n=1 Tax=Saccharicrinis fermentans DSM 9555 = JCM 21142 TaxID=869213 RepID=W7Y6L9_9BACT|nr:lipid-A-disaccharide synthase [Saccharicrinis fermentans]GAF03872.1 lipid-A-disaccharide synthase [Saccharicrinis fermentans DSM 9555 = JCM 21142]